MIPMDQIMLFKVIFFQSNCPALAPLKLCICLVTKLILIKINNHNIIIIFGLIITIPGRVFSNLVIMIIPIILLI